MKNFQFKELSSENTLAKTFLIVNSVVFTAIFDWSEFFVYVSKINESGCKPIPPPISSKISFGIYDLTSHISDLDYILAALLVIFSIFYLPSYLAAMAVTGAMKNDYPHWCAETFDLTFIPIFSVINIVYLMLLSYLIRHIHDLYCQHKSPPENLLSIRPD